MDFVSQNLVVTEVFATFEEGTAGVLSDGLGEAVVCMR